MIITNAKQHKLVIFLLFTGFWAALSHFLTWPGIDPKKTDFWQIITFFPERALPPGCTFPLDITERHLDLALFCINWKFDHLKNFRMFKNCRFPHFVKKKTEEYRINLRKYQSPAPFAHINHSLNTRLLAVFYSAKLFL